MLSAESLLAKPAIEERRKFQNAKARYGVNIDKDIYDMMICGCGPAIAKVITMTEGEVFTGHYAKSGERVKVSFLKSEELSDIIDSSNYRVSELVERSILTIMGSKND